MPLLPSSPADACFAYVDSRQPIGYCTPTRNTPAFEDRYIPFQNMLTFDFPSPPSEPSSARHQLPKVPVRNVAHIRALIRAQTPVPIASSLPVAFPYETPVKISAKVQDTLIPWRGGSCNKTRDKLLKLGLACLILTGFQSPPPALASSSKSSLTSVEMHAAMLALRGALGSFKVASKTCQQ